MPKKKINIDFEKNLKRLEEISSLLESEQLGLEESIALFEEGVKLSKTCISGLKNAELKITKLKKELSEVTPGDEETIEDNY